MGERTPRFLKSIMARQIKIFKSFEEQEMYFLQYFFELTPSERLERLAVLQKKNNPNFLKPSPKKITIRKHFADGR
jgi:hypothetical protein